MQDLAPKRGKALVVNFVRQYRQPFDLKTVVNLVGVSKRVAMAALNNLEAEGQVRKTSAGIYVAITRPVFNCIEINGQTWNYKKDVAKQLLAELGKNVHTSMRSIGKAMGVSRQYAYMYMLALGSLRMVGWNGQRWYPTGEGDISRIGSVIEKGCLAAMKGRGRDSIE